MEHVKNGITWFEIPVVDFERAKQFYSAIFDYEMPEMPMGPLRMGVLPYDQEAGGVGGVIVLGEGYTPAGHSGIKVYLNGGEDLCVVLDRIAGAGGKVVMSKTHITPEIGYMAVFNDTEGNVVALHSPN